MDDLTKNEEETLDPASWEEFRRLGRQMVDDMTDYLSTVRDRPAWRTVPSDARDALAEPLPRTGDGLAAAYESFTQNILPYPTGNQHPRFFGWVMGNGTPSAMLADMLASGMNPHLAGYDQSASLVEKTVIQWFAEIMGFPADASGVLVSGATAANINGLTVARHAKSPIDIRRLGLQHPDAPRFRVYGSRETHSWIYAACELMGMGRDAFVAVDVDEHYRIRIDACRAAIEADRAAGLFPFCVMGTAGTVNTAAIDDLPALRRLADEFDLWFHVDGAFGSMVALSDQIKGLVAGQERADSIAFDLHKWGYLPYDIACILVRDPDLQRAAFGREPSYLISQSRGVSVETTYFADRGLQLSRSFRALKAWMALKEHGADKIGRLIAQNVEQARYLADLVRRHPKLTLAAPAPLNIVCLRYKIDDPAESDAVNNEILLRLQESGSAVPSHTILDGRFAIRICNTNHRTRYADLDALIEDIAAIGDTVEAERAANS